MEDVRRYVDEAMQLDNAGEVSLTLAKERANIRL